MRRLTSRDAPELNAMIGKHWPESDADFTPYLDNPLNVCLVIGSSGTLFVWHGPGVYEIHIAYDVGGREALDILEKATRYMLDNFAIRLFWAMIPEASRKVRLFARWAGWQSHGLLANGAGEHELFVREIA